jgi:BolA protein
MNSIDSIKAALKANYNPEQLEIVDESYQHAGHAGHGKYSHLLIKLSLAPFKEMSRLDRTRKLMKDIYAAAGQPIHAVRFEFLN